MDYEDGMPIDELRSYLDEAQRVGLAEEKRQVQAMSVAIASCFKSDVMSKYMAAVDKAIDAPRQDDARRENAVDHSIKELQKLGTLFRQQRAR